MVAAVTGGFPSPLVSPSTWREDVQESAGTWLAGREERGGREGGREGGKEGGRKGKRKGGGSREEGAGRREQGGGRREE